MVKTRTEIEYHKKITVNKICNWLTYLCVSFQLMEGSLIGRSLVIVARPVVSGGNAVFGRALTLPPRGRERPVKGNTLKQRNVKCNHAEVWWITWEDTRLYSVNVPHRPYSQVNLSRVLAPIHEYPSSTKHPRNAQAILPAGELGNISNSNMEGP